MKRKSVFSKKYWMDQGLSESEAIFQIQIRRPNNVNYYINKFDCSLEEANEKLKKFQKLGIKSRNKEKSRKSNKRCVDYWLSRGYDLEQSKQQVSKLQSTFSLEKCIKKYGILEGTSRWQQRQKKWQQTLKNKTKEERDNINHRKNGNSYAMLSKNMTNDEIVVFMKQKKNMTLFTELEQFNQYVKQKLKTNADLYYSPVDKFIRNFSALQFDILKIKDKVGWASQFIKQDSSIVYKSNSKQTYRKWIEQGLLRSSYEILFHEKLIEYKIRFLLDGKYPNSSMRYDFFLPDFEIYIEICPMYSKDEKYTLKMDRKKQLFGCILLKDEVEFDHFLNEIMEKNASNNTRHI